MNFSQEHGNVPTNSDFDLLFEAIPTPILVLDRKSLRFLTVNKAALDFYGYTEAEFLQLRLPDIRPESVAGEIEGMIARFGDPSLPDTPRLHVTRGGERKIVRVNARTYNFRGHEAILAAVFDITHQQEMEREVRRARAFLTNLVDRVPTALFAKDVETGQYIFYNSTAETLFGLSRRDVIGRASAQIFPEEEALKFAQQDREALEAGDKGITCDQTIRVEGESCKTIRVKKVVISDGDTRERRYILGVAEDVTAERIREEQISHMAMYDTLTGLANRWLFHKRLQELVAKAHETDRKLAIHYIDLDGFKSVNDTMGHAAGDEVLRAAANRMLSVVRKDDVVARFGGDEFAVLQPDVRAVHEAEALAQRMVSILSQPYDLNGKTCEIGASVGISLASPEMPVELSIELADSALYSAKRAGKRRFVYQEKA